MGTERRRYVESGPWRAAIGAFTVATVCMSAHSRPGQTVTATPPVVVSAALPVAPPIARAPRVPAEVRLRVSTDGRRVVTVTVIKQSAIEQAAVENVKTWQFAPHSPTSFEVTYRMGGYYVPCNDNNSYDLTFPTTISVLGVAMILDRPTCGPKPLRFQRLPAVTATLAPMYPPDARLADIEGTVQLRLASVPRIEVIAATTPILANAAVDYANSWSFTAGEGGVFDVTFRYTLAADRPCDDANTKAVLHFPSEIAISASRPCRSARY